MDREKLLTALRQEARELQRDDVPEFLGALETIRCHALATLAAPAPPPPDENLEVPEAAHRLGVSVDYLYRSHKKYPFTRREGRKLLFSSAGLDSYLTNQDKEKIENEKTKNGNRSQSGRPG